MSQKTGNLRKRKVSQVLEERFPEDASEQETQSREILPQTEGQQVISNDVVSNSSDLKLINFPDNFVSGKTSLFYDK